MATGLVENLLRWDQLARLNVNQRAAELSLGHLIHIGDRVIKIAPTIPPVVNHWVAGTRLAGLVSPVIIGKRLFTPAIAPIPKVIVTSLITAPNALLLTAAGVAVERLAARALGPRRIAPPAAMRISSLKDGRCLTNGGLGLGFKRCGAAGTDEWRFERTSPRVPLTRKAVLGLIHGANGERFFAVAEPNAPGIWWPSSTPTVRLCADRWCVRSVSRGPNNFIVPLANAYVALAPISRYSGSSGLMALLPPAPAAADEIPLAVYAMVLVAVALVTLALAKRLVESWTRRNDAAVAAQRAPEEAAVAVAAAKPVREKKNWHLPAMAPYLNPEMQPRSPGSSRARPIERQNSWERYSSRPCTPNPNPNNPNPNPNPNPNLTYLGTAHACPCRPWCKRPARPSSTPSR